MKGGRTGGFGDVTYDSGGPIKRSTKGLRNKHSRSRCTGSGAPMEASNPRFLWCQQSGLDSIISAGNEGASRNVLHTGFMTRAGREWRRRTLLCGRRKQTSLMQSFQQRERCSANAFLCSRGLEAAAELRPSSEQPEPQTEISDDSNQHGGAFDLTVTTRGKSVHRRSFLSSE